VDAYYIGVPVSVLLVDPQPFFCESLARALDPEAATIVGWTGDEIEAAALAESESPDVVLTELELAGGSGFSLAKRVAGSARVVVLTRRAEGDVLFDALDAGAHGVVGHATGLRGLEGVLAGVEEQSWLADPIRLRDSLRRARGQATQRDGSEGRIARLTVREREVLQLLARGLAREEIASSLYLSAHTVRTHLGNILKKLEVHSQAEAARVALRAGLAASDVHVVRISGPDLSAR
jgi:DNA-binding NarL/FixJ family response regulator